MPQVQLVIWSLAALAAPGFTIALRLGRRYTHALVSSRANLFDAILRDQVLYVTYSMMALGFVAMLMWEGVFPDRRDARMLGVLPLSTRTHVAGRLAGLGAFAALFSVGINLPAAVAYGFVLFVYEAAAGPVRIAAAHLIATAMAGLFAFFLLILAQGVLLNVFGRTIVRRLALVLQSVLIVALLQALIFVPFIGCTDRRRLPQRPAVAGRVVAAGVVSRPLRHPGRYASTAPRGVGSCRRCGHSCGRWRWGRCSSPRATGAWSASRSKRQMVAGTAARGCSAEPHGRWPVSFVLVPFSAPWPGSHCGASPAVGLT